MEAHRHQPMVSRHLSSKDCMSATLIDCEKKWNTLMMWLAGWHEICLCSRQPSYPGMVPSWKSKWWRFFRLWTVFLSSGLFVGPPPTGRRDELPFKLEFFTHSSDPTLLCHYKCSAELFLYARALSIGVLISFEHHIDAHHINTLMHDCCHSRCDRAGWLEEVKNVVSLSQ